MKYIGLDYGSKTCGVAVSDSTGLIASGEEVIRYNDIEELINKICKLVSDKRIDKIVIGNPLNMDGSLSDRSKETFKLKEMLELKLKKEVIMQDERLSTTEAERVLINNGTKRKNRKKVIDKMAAVIILQSYLDRK